MRPVKSIIDRARARLAGWLYPSLRFRKSYSPGFVVPRGSSSAASRDRAFGALYENVATVFGATRLIATSLAAVPMVVMRRDRAGQLAPVDSSHPLAQLLETFNPYTDAYREWVKKHSWQELTGDGFWYLPGGDGFRTPEEIRTLNPAYMKPVTDPNQGVRSWIYSPPGVQPLTLTFDEVVHFRNFNPGGGTSTAAEVLGMSALAPALKSAILDEYAIEFNLDFFEEGATLGGFLKTPQPLNDDTVEGLENRFNFKHRGSGKGHRWHFLTHGLEAQEIGSTQKDMGWSSLRDYSREDLLMVLGVPPALVGLLDSSHYNNAEQQERYFWKYRLLPMSRQDQATATRRLARRYGEDLYLVYDFGDVEALQDPLQAITAAAASMRMGGALTPEQERLWVLTRRFPGRDPIPEPHGSTYYLPLGVVPADEAGGGLGGLNFGDPGGGQEKAPEAADLIDKALEELETAKGYAQAEGIRRAAWLKYDAAARRFERLFARISRSMFREQGEAVLAALDNLPADAFQRNGHPIKVKQGEDLEPILQAASVVTKYSAQYGIAYEATVGYFGQSALDAVLEGASFSFVSPDTKAFIERAGFELVQSLNETTGETLRQELGEAMEAGETLADIRDRIKRVFSDAGTNRAKTIARTETHRATGFGTEQGYKQSGVVKGKEWLSSRDIERTRTAHLLADKQRVPLSQPFRVWEEPLRFPGDPNGSAKNTINCRCTMLPIVLENSAGVLLTWEPKELPALPSGADWSSLLGVEELTPC